MSESAKAYTGQLIYPFLFTISTTASSRNAGSGTAASSSRRFDTTEEIKQKCSIVIKNVPEETNSKPYLKKFFTQFGTVTKVRSMPSSSMAIIHFDNHVSELSTTVFITFDQLSWVFGSQQLTMLQINVLLLMSMSTAEGPFVHT